MGEAGDDLYDKALAVVARERRATTSYIQRRLQIGYNRAASLIERMEEDGVISRPNHKGVREVLLPEHEQRVDVLDSGVMARISADEVRRGKWRRCCWHRSTRSPDPRPPGSRQCRCHRR